MKHRECFPILSVKATTVKHLFTDNFDIFLTALWISAFCKKQKPPVWVMKRYNRIMFKELFSQKTSTKSRIILLIKMIVAFILGILLAELFQLRYEYTAGVIAVLSLEPTRKRSIRSAVLRILDSLLALGIAAGLFALLGYDFWVLLIFITVLVPLTFLFRLETGLVVALVLVSQIYLEKDVAFALNALLILLVSLSLAFVLNLYMPKHDQIIQRSIDTIDHAMDEAIQAIALSQPVDFSTIHEDLKQAKNTLLLDIENHYLVQTDQRILYLEVRQNQLQILEKIQEKLAHIPEIPEKAIVLNYLQSFKGKIGKANYALPLKEQLKKLLDDFKVAPLPKSRDEFENRAELFHILLEMENFLNLKLRYHERY